ncbi:MAG: rhodanese-like domain-containing protein [Chloroflexi bacterium]|nr:MAG: rhodanese-like domain-containing protein [Chloroflexota bacterium]
MISTSIGGRDMAFVPYWMNPTRAKEAIEAGQAIVLDVTSQFIEGAVRGRIVVKEVPGLSRDKTIIAYCTCPDEEASARLTRVLRDEGYDAWMLDGGLPAWRAAGYPMEVNQAA